MPMIVVLDLPQFCAIVDVLDVSYVFSETFNFKFSLNCRTETFVFLKESYFCKLVSNLPNLWWKNIMIWIYLSVHWTRPSKVLKNQKIVQFGYFIKVKFEIEYFLVFEAKIFSSCCYSLIEKNNVVFSRVIQGELLSMFNTTGISASKRAKEKELNVEILEVFIFWKKWTICLVFWKYCFFQFFKCSLPMYSLMQ